MLKVIQAVSGSAEGMLESLQVPSHLGRRGGCYRKHPFARRLWNCTAPVLPGCSTGSSDQRLRAVPFLQCLLFVSSRQKGMCALEAGKCPESQDHMGPASVAG